MGGKGENNMASRGRHLIETNDQKMSIISIVQKKGSENIISIVPHPVLSYAAVSATNTPQLVESFWNIIVHDAGNINNGLFSGYECPITIGAEFAICDISQWRLLG